MTRSFQATLFTRGLYGDVIEELDANVGRLLQTLRDENLAERTLVIFTSDNGPWQSRNDHGGSAGLLRGGKFSTWEGGMRVPAIAWWPGRIQPGTVTRSPVSDPSEQFNVARDNSETIADLSAEIERHRKTVVPVKLQLDDWATSSRRNRKGEVIWL